MKNLMKFVCWIGGVAISANILAIEVTVIPNAKIADQVATIVLESIYGNQILSQKPFIVVEKNGVWHIDGRLPKPPKGSVVVGGVVHCEINKSDGAFKNIIHGK